MDWFNIAASFEPAKDKATFVPTTRASQAKERSGPAARTPVVDSNAALSRDGDAGTGASDAAKLGFGARMKEVIMPTATKKEDGSDGGRKPRADQKRAKKVASAVLDAPAVLDATAVEDELSEDGAFASVASRAACRCHAATRSSPAPPRGRFLLRELALTFCHPFSPCSP
jgi:hypothetical protein